MFNPATDADSSRKRMHFVKILGGDMSIRAAHTAILYGWLYESFSLQTEIGCGVAIDICFFPNYVRNRRTEVFVSSRLIDVITHPADSSCPIAIN